MDEQEKLIDDLIQILDKLDWSIALPKQPDEDDMVGMIIGKKEYINSILDSLEETNWEFPKKKEEMN